MQDASGSLLRRSIAPDELPPECHFFVAYKVGWVRINDDLPQYSEWAPN